MKFLKRVFLYADKGHTFNNFAVIVLWSVLNVYYVRMLSKLTASVFGGDTESIGKLVVFYALYLFFWECIEYVGDFLDFMMQVKLESTITKSFLRRIYQLKPSVIKKYNTGYLNGLVSKYEQHNSSCYNHIVLYFPLAGVYVVYAVFQMGTYNAIFGIILAAIIFLGVSVQLLMRRKTIVLGQRLTDCEGNRSKRFIDTVSNIGTVQKMDGFSRVNEMLEGENAKCHAAGTRFMLFNELGFVLYKLLIFSYLPICILIYSLRPGITDTPVDMFSYLAVICVQLVHMVKNISTAITSMIEFHGTCKKVDVVFCDENMRSAVLPMQEFRSVSVTDVRYEYLNAENSVTTTVIIPSFTVNAGDVIGIYGESGQGKTTLLNILSGELQTGCVRINGLITKNRLDCVYIAQDNAILDMSLRDNLALGRDIDDATIIEYLGICGLSDWFERQKDGLDTPLGEKGVFVSTGQRQRLNLIRGLLVQDKEIYLLDEPTSNVDDATEKQMIDLIMQCLKGKTVIIVTHRPAILSICNRVYKFEGGVCKETDCVV